MSSEIGTGPPISWIRTPAFRGPLIAKGGIVAGEATVIRLLSSIAHI